MVPLLGLVVNLGAVAVLSALGYSGAKSLGEKLVETKTSTKPVYTDYSNRTWTVSKDGEQKWDIETAMKSVTELRNINQEYRPYKELQLDDDIINKKVPKEIIVAVVSSTGIKIDDQSSKWDVMTLLTDTDKQILMFLLKCHEENISSIKK